MIGCKFCEKIWNSQEEYKNQFDDRWDERNSIVMKNGEPYLYVPCEQDSFYSDVVMQINYCPKCGRKVNMNYKVMR